MIDKESSQWYKTSATFYGVIMRSRFFIPLFTSIALLLATQEGYFKFIL